MYIWGVQHDVICGFVQLQCCTLEHNMDIGSRFDAVELNMIKQVPYDHVVPITKNKIDPNNNNIQ